MQNDGVAVPARATRATPRAAARLGHAASIANAPPFNAYKAWEETRDENGVLWDALARSLYLIGSMADRLERQGEDVTTHRAFIRNTRSRVLG